MALAEHLRTGLRGEQLAARYLRDADYTVIAANSATRRGELDIVALDPLDGLHFVEVKTRSPGGRFPPAKAVDSEKKKHLISAANTFLRHTDFGYRGVHFDIMEVILYDLNDAELHLITDAFRQRALPYERTAPETDAALIKKLMARLFGSR